jgi:hypothetical protein
MPKMTAEQRRAFWRERIVRCQQSPLTIAQFCKQEHCSPGAFYWWKRLLSQSSPLPSKVIRSDSRSIEGGAKAQSPTERFVPITMRESVPSIQLRLPGGAWFQLPTRVDPEQLRTLVSATIDATCHDARSGDNS